MVEAQGYVIDDDKTLVLPKCGAPMSMNLRADQTFLAYDGSVSGCSVRVSEFWGSLCAGRNQKEIHLHQRRYRRNSDTDIGNITKEINRIQLEKESINDMMVM